MLQQPRHRRRTPDRRQAVTVHRQTRVEAGTESVFANSTVWLLSLSMGQSGPHAGSGAGNLWVLFLHLSYLFVYSKYLFERQRETKRDGDGVFSSAGSLSKCPRRLGPGQAKAGSRELNLGLPRGRQGPNHVSHHGSLPGCTLARG